MVKTTCVWLKEQRERLFVFSVALEAFSITTGYEPKRIFCVFALKSTLWRRLLVPMSGFAMRRRRASRDGGKLRDPGDHLRPPWEMPCAT